MQQEILNELVTIKYLLIGILFSTGIPMIAVVASKFMGVRFQDQTRGEKFGVVCSQLLEDGEYDELVKYCEAELAKRPNSAIANYNIGRALYEQNDFHSAKEYFLKARELDPTWDKKFISPFLEKIAAKH